MNNIQQVEPSIYKQLSPRELEVARHASEKKGIKQTALVMGIKVSTVQNHRQRAMRKLGCANMACVLVSLIRAGLL